MDNFEITIKRGKVSQTFQIRDYVHHNCDKCKFEVFNVGKLILTLEPHGNYLQTCKNPGGLDEETIHQIIDQIEVLNI